MKKLLVVLLAFAVFGTILYAEKGARENEPPTLFEFHSLSAVKAPFTGATNPVRGVPGAGADWKIASGKAELNAAGELEASVTGLVLVRTGTNPIASFQAVLNCQTVDNVGAATTVNVTLPPAPATAAGDWSSEGHISLPSPCNGAIVFVVIPATPTAAARWLAVSGF